MSHSDHCETRRGFLRASVGLTAAALGACASSERARGAPKKVLVLGGTRFIGPHIVEAALARGHRVTLFNRGKTNPELFPECEKLRGDRDGDMSALEGRRWDAVLDTWTDMPRHVRSAATLLGPNVGQYVFVSSLNAVADLSQPHLDETAETTPLEPKDEDNPSAELFGGRKARCEKLLAELCTDRYTIVRPGLIVGPRDGSDRFTYWPVRIARGGEVLAPGSGDDPTQFVDARDLAEFVVRLVERRTLGLFHVVGPERELSMREVLETCVRVAENDARLTWVDTRFLLERGVAPWTDLPAWLPSLEPGHAYWTLNVSKAIRAGLAFRPLDETVRDTLAWWATLPEARRAELKRGLAPERERELLAQWHARPS
ncbi:MAG: NAD-dependent epimerase/dehydratase family protein [Planctomycetes bacterium]|nr:NAD-dependent epimerase/dehydratase family protein [Planctomycetota bacterium]